MLIKTNNQPSISMVGIFMPESPNHIGNLLEQAAIFIGMKTPIFCEMS